MNNDFFRRVLSRTIFVFGIILSVFVAFALFILSLYILHISLTVSFAWGIAIIPIILVIVFAICAVVEFYKEMEAKSTFRLYGIDDFTDDVMSMIEDAIDSIFGDGTK